MSIPKTAPGRDHPLQILDNADALSARYPVWLCDVWGVVHNGIAANQAACAALTRHRQGGGTVILITNAPRPSTVILPQLDLLKVPPESWDAIVSSGDVTRHLVSRWQGRNVYHLGPEKDLALLEGLPVTYTPAEQADVILCSGLIDDDSETPEDYRAELAQLRARGLEMICANPDRVVRKGSRLLPCAGALADIYEELGGVVQMAGKPYAPIYEECLRQAALVRPQMPDRSGVLAIGDGLSTDVKGAAANDLDMLFIVTGIHEFELDGADAGGLMARVKQAAPNVRLAGIMTGLR